ncbi:MAG: glycosyltransferase, partial [Owenweeksia sp.]
MRILMLADKGHPNTRNWKSSLEKYGNAQVKIWSLPNSHIPLIGRIQRILTWGFANLALRKEIKDFKPDLVIGYRLTSYGFLAARTGFSPLVLASQGITDVWPLNHW